MQQSITFPFSLGDAVHLITDAAVTGTVSAQRNEASAQVITITYTDPSGQQCWRDFDSTQLQLP